MFPRNTAHRIQRRFFSGRPALHGQSQYQTVRSATETAAVSSSGASSTLAVKPARPLRRYLGRAFGLSVVGGAGAIAYGYNTDEGFWRFCEFFRRCVPIVLHYRYMELCNNQTEKFEMLHDLYAETAMDIVLHMKGSILTGARIHGVMIIQHYGLLCLCPPSSGEMPHLVNYQRKPHSLLSIIVFCPRRWQVRKKFDPPQATT